MILLAIETSGPICGVCCLESGQIPVVEVWRHDRMLASDLAPRIRTCLEAAGLSLHDLDAVACGAGPGSFTGLRVGVTAAKSLAAVLDLRLVLPSTLAALAAARPDGHRQLALLPASGGRIAAALYTAGSWKPDDALREGIRTPGEIGEACSGLRLDFTPCIPEWADIPSLDPPLTTPPARVPAGALVAAVAGLGMAMLDEGIETAVHVAMPRYLQPSTPELRLFDRPNS